MSKNLTMSRHILVDFGIGRYVSLCLKITDSSVEHGRSFAFRSEIKIGMAPNLIFTSLGRAGRTKFCV
jgi:hypothetical protein